jgi:lipopolysaccharide transport system ATP-binding protein
MKEGVTVLLVSHSIGQIRKICDRCIWIENGRVYMEGPSRQVCDAYVKRAKK